MARDAGKRAKQCERAAAAEPRLWSGRVTGSLPLHTHRGAEDGDDHAGETAQVEVHGVRIL